MSIPSRKLVFIAIAAAVILPLLFNVALDTSVTPETQRVYANIDSLQSGSVIMISFDFEASSFAEVRPLAEVIIKHAFDKNHRIIALSLFAEGTALGSELLRTIAQEQGKIYGIDYAYLGFRPQYQMAILSMGESIVREFPRDYFGDTSADLQLLQLVQNYGQVAQVISIADGSMPTYWIEYAVTPHHVNFQAIVTASMATSFYPYLASGQIKGIAAGLKGAAEYESLLHTHGAGSRGLFAQAVSQLAVVLIIILGNIVERSRRKG